MKTSSWDRKMEVSPEGRWAGTPGYRESSYPWKSKRQGAARGSPALPRVAPKPARVEKAPTPLLAHSRSSSKCVSIPSGPGTEQTSRAFRKVLHLFTRQQWPPSSFCNSETPVLSPACPPACSPACPLPHPPGRCARCANRPRDSVGHQPTSLGRRSRACHHSSRCCQG